MFGNKGIALWKWLRLSKEINLSFICRLWIFYGNRDKNSALNVSKRQVFYHDIKPATSVIDKILAFSTHKHDLYIYFLCNTSYGAIYTFFVKTHNCKRHVQQILHSQLNKKLIFKYEVYVCMLFFL